VAENWNKLHKGLNMFPYEIDKRIAQIELDTIGVDDE